MVLVYLLCLFVCQVPFIRPDGINPPTTQFVHLPIDQRTLSALLSPNVCIEAPTSSLPTGARLIESNTPTMSSESCFSESPQPVDLASAPKLPFNTVSISAPLIDPHLPSNEAPLQTQPFSPSIAITPQISAIPPVNLYNVESCDSVKSNIISNDCTQKAIPPIILKIPGYFVTSEDNYCGNSNYPVRTVKLDNMPQNICKIKVGGSKPIFIDCSKQTNNYKSPVALTPVNPIEIQNIGKPNTPNLQIISNLAVDNPNELKDLVLPAAPIKILEEIATVPPRSNNILTNEKCINTLLPIEQTTNTEILASTGKVLYPINNVKFNYGPNIFSPFQNACTEKTQPIPPPKLLPMDSNIGLVAPSVVNVIDNSKSTQYDIKLPDNERCVYNNVNSLPNPEQSSYFSTSSSPCLFNPASLFISEEKLPITEPQLPNVNAINTIIQTQCPILPSPVPSQPMLETGPDSFTSGLSYSLNNIVTLLTKGLLSKLFENVSPEQSFTDAVPIETCDASKEPVLDIIPSINIEMPYTSNLPLSTCPPLVECCAILPNPMIGVGLKASDYSSESKTSSVLCTENSPKRKPYIASITINITPTTEASNDIIIIV